MVLHYTAKTQHITKRAGKNAATQQQQQHQVYMAKLRAAEEGFLRGGWWVLSHQTIKNPGFQIKENAE